MEHGKREFIVGLFIIAGFAAFVYISLQFGEFSVFSMEKQYELSAQFDNVSGLKAGAVVEIAGVNVGKVAAIRLSKDDRAIIDMRINAITRVSDDAIASIRTQGIIGDKYVKIIQGGSSDLLKAGDIIYDTESAIDLEEMISKYIFGDI